MCLRNRYNESRVKREIKRMGVQMDKDGYIHLYKGFGVRGDGTLRGSHRIGVEFYEGKNTAKRPNRYCNKRGIPFYDGRTGAQNYYPYGFHCFVDRDDAKHWGDYMRVVKVKPEWIVAMGENSGKCVVCKHMIID